MKNRFWIVSMLMSGCAAQMDYTCAADSDFDSGVHGKEMQVVFDLRDDLQTHFNFSFIHGSGTTNTAPDAPISANTDFKLNSIDSLLDWHPVTGGFFVSGGAITSRAPSLQNGTLTRTAAPLTGSLTTNITDLHNVTPYLGLGWASRKVQKRGWRLLSDIGMLYRGRTTLSLTSTSCILNNVGALSVCQGFDYGSAGSIPNDGRNNLARYVPVLRAGISYLF